MLNAMTTLGSMVKGGKVYVVPQHVGLEKLDLGQVMIDLSEAPPGLDVPSLAASIAVTVNEFVDQSVASILASLTAMIYQDDDAHDTCSLTACLNPLHPGPCKGWKGTLFKAAPGAFHAIEGAKAEKANTARLAKISDLKAKGLPIPKKLLTPITPKAHPDAGKTANKASGEAHAAGKAVSDAAGIKAGTPGKVSLGQATKTLTPAEKGPKGKKPTLASKGIAFVISQPKVTDQYKLDKASTITTEQWNALSEADQSMVHGELAKISINGFGVQEEKANKLLAKLPVGAQPESATAPKPKLTDTPETPTAVEKVQADNAAHLKAQADAVAKAAPLSGILAKAKADAPLGGKPAPKAEPTKLSEAPKAPPEKLGGGKEPKAPGASAAPTKMSEIATPNAAVTTGGKPKPLPAHVQNAIDMAKGQAPGASWSKNHLVAYQPLTAEEFHALPPAVQAKIASELTKAQTKFLDPKKTAAAKALLEKFQGKGVKAAAKAAPENVTFQGNLHDHSVTKAQAKEVAAQTPLGSHFLAAKTLAGLTDADNPDAPQSKADVAKQVDQFIDSQTGPHEDGKILDQPDVKAALENAAKTMQDLKYAQAVHKAKTSAFNKINLKLAGGAPGLAPLEAASLEHYQKSLLSHPVKTDMATMDKLQHDAAASIGDLHVKLLAAKKKANAPKAQDMSPVQLNDRVKELMGEDAAQPKVNLSQGELKTALDAGKAVAAAEAGKYPPEVLDDPNVKAKLGWLDLAAGQLEATKVSQEKLDKHLDEYHLATMTTGLDAAGNPLSADDEKAIELHQKQILVNHKYLKTSEVAGQQKLLTAMDAFHLAADSAKQDMKPVELIKLSSFDQATIPKVYAAAWFKHVDKAVTYGLKTNVQAQKMKAHPDFLSLKQDLADLKTLSGQLALASAEKHTAKLNVPTDEAGAMIDGPERKAWLAAVIHQNEVAKQFETLHKVAQGKLDTIRTDVGLKKRALPKADAPAVKAAAAEAGYYESASHGGPNYGKPAAAKNYMLAKVGPQHAVVHLSPAEKKAEKLGAGNAPSTAKIENKPSGEPVKLGGGDSSIAHVPDPLKKQITSDFKGMPKGKYLADPPEDIFGNLVNLAAAHGKTVPAGLSVDQVLKAIDETHSKSLGVPNGGMLHKKITEWLGTAEGKAYAESHSTPSPKVIKQITGEVELPKGVVLEPGQKVQQLAGPGKFDASLKGSDFHPFTAAQAQTEQDAYMKAQGIKWTPGAKKGMTAYTGNGPAAYDGINNYLRGKPGYDQVVKQYAVDIQSAMMPLRKGTLLKRGTGWPPGMDQFKSDPLAAMGHTFEDKGFVSSTVAGSSGHFSGKPLQLTIEAPEGTPAAFVNGISNYKGSENEMLLAAGLKFKVLSVEVKGHQTFMRVRVVGAKTHEES